MGISLNSQSPYVSINLSISAWSLAGFAVRSRCSLRGGLTSYLGSDVITQRLQPRFAPRLPRSDTPASTD